MTPKEKAEQLVSNFYFINSKLIIVKNGYDMGERYNLVMPIAKKCALIAVDEILKNNIILFEDVLNDQYWKNIKQEIEKL